MNQIVKLPGKVARYLLQGSQIRLIRASKYDLLERMGYIGFANRWASTECPAELVEFVISNLLFSKSQIQQDLWALYEFKKRGNSSGERGFFVEFGATDGILRSNTYLLEKQYGWKGILSEPAKSFANDLRNNRSAAIDTRCVFSKTSQKVIFHEVDSLELSGIQEFNHIGGWEEQRKSFTAYEVETVSLHDLLLQHKAPRKINYISVDTEGSEFEILSAFPFNEWEIDCFSVEHNYSENEAKIDKLLSSYGYKRVLSQTSCWDAWYIRDVEG
jgi:FkbM family methyltransferase